MQRFSFPRSLSRLWIAFALLISTAAAEMDLPRLAKQARPSVVLVEVLDDYGRPLATGTAFLCGMKGRGVLTNRHVIEHPHCGSIRIRAHDGAELIVTDVWAPMEKPDLALIQIRDEAWMNAHLGEPLAFAQPARAEAGERVAVIGSPLGYEGSLSDGIVSAVRAEKGEPTLFQITAAISPGSSGSPVLNEAGKVLGIATWTRRGGQALNFAVAWDAIHAFRAATETKFLTPKEHSRRVFEERHRGQDYAAAHNAMTDAHAKQAKAQLAWLQRGGTPTLQTTRTQYREAFKDALPLLERLREDHPEDVSVCRDMGRVYLLQGDFHAAALALQSALEIYPHDHEALAQLGDVFTEAGDTEKARQYYRRAVAKAEALPEAKKRGEWPLSAVGSLIFLAECHEKLGDLSAALARCSEARELSRGVALSETSALLAQGRILARMGQEERALDALLAIERPGKSEREGRAEAYQALASILFDCGMDERGGYWWQRHEREKASIAAAKLPQTPRNTGRKTPRD